MTQTDDALKPCPFCGSTKIEAENNGHNPFYICAGCNAYGPDGLAAWNRRADLAPTPQDDPRVKALIAATKGFVTASYRGTAHTHLVEAREGVLAALAAFDTTGGKPND